MQSDYHAYCATRTHIFDLHVSRMTEKQEVYPQAEFERIVRSLRVLLLRRGWKEEYPPEIAVPMTLASVLGVDGKTRNESYLVRRAEQWPAHFANAMLHESRGLVLYGAKRHADSIAPRQASSTSLDDLRGWTSEEALTRRARPERGRRPRGVGRSKPTVRPPRGRTTRPFALRVRFVGGSSTTTTARHAR